MSAGTNRSIPTPVSVPNGGTGLAAGTSGGIPAYTGATTIASSGVLAANSLMKGGGAGVAPSTITTGAGVITALGIAPDASGGFSTLRKYSGSLSLNNASFSGVQTFAVTVTGAAAGDSVSFSYPPDLSSVVVLCAVTVTTNTVTFTFNTMVDILAIPEQADWSASGNTLYASIIK